MKVDENMWSFFQNHLGYNDAEMKKFKEDPKNEKVLSKALELTNKTIVVEDKFSQKITHFGRRSEGRSLLDGFDNVIADLCIVMPKDQRSP